MGFIPERLLMMTMKAITILAGLVNADTYAYADASEKILNASRMRMRQ